MSGAQHPCPVCGRTAGFRPAREFLAEVRAHNAALGAGPAAQPPQGQAAAPQAPEAQPRNSAEDVSAEALTGNKNARPTILALVLASLSGALVGAIAGAGGIWVLLGMVVSC